MWLDPCDLAPFAVIEPAKADALIAAAEARAMLAAPCLKTVVLDAAGQAALVAILRDVVLRWNDTGAGAVTTESAGPWTRTVETRGVSAGKYWPAEIADLQKLCGAAGRRRRAFEIDTTPGWASGYTWESPDVWVPLP